MERFDYQLETTTGVQDGICAAETMQQAADHIVFRANWLTAYTGIPHRVTFIRCKAYDDWRLYDYGCDIVPNEDGL